MNMTRPSVAGFCVEVDLTKDHPKQGMPSPQLKLDDNEKAQTTKKKEEQQASETLREIPQTPAMGTLITVPLVAETVIVEALVTESVAARTEGSFSGLTDKEKIVVIVDVPSEVIPVTKVFNSFAALETIDEAATEVVDSDDDERGENVYIDNHPPVHQGLNTLTDVDDLKVPLRSEIDPLEIPPGQPQLTVREAALPDFQSEKGQQLIAEVNQYRMSVGLPEYDPIGNLLKLNKNEKISEDDSLVQSPHPPSQTECEELEETKEINSLDIPSSPDSSGIYIVVKHDSLILRVGDKDVDQVDFDESNIPIVSKEGFEVDTCGEVVPGIRDIEDDVKNGSMKDQEEDQWYKIEFEKEDVVVLEYKFIFSHGKENHYKRFIIAVEHGFFCYRDGYSD
ncbi:OLC1v1005496C1 [Oldenlandia corymbosa var. corymbosa]|uniref:OLC1v1005496C1 n=1 Tax=Oldenlandia corymbosa var. corymbosa TaxID=529605 RepID=A0AAV1DF98_OLDCO|nr:OLC1v1005496C1 [Oldenlandia corymbosa var. corymbosa]